MGQYRFVPTSESLDLQPFEALIVLRFWVTRNISLVLMIKIQRLALIFGFNCFVLHNIYNLSIVFFSKILDA